MRLTRNCFYSLGILSAAASGIAFSASAAMGQSSIEVDPSHMSKLGTVDPRYVSYNVEMVEVTGGRFWRPYKSPVTPQEAAKPSTPSDINQQVGVSDSLFEYRAPIDLSNPRLRKLAAALGPVYMRVSGSWANSTYFQDDDLPALKEPPKGFRGVLTRAEWKAVVDFSRAVDAKIVTSVSVSPGARDANGVWTPDQAKALFDYTKSIGGSIAATEFMNEPTFPGPGGAPAGYDAAAFAKDIQAFEPFLRKESPQTVFLGPGGVMEGLPMTLGGTPAGMQLKLLASEDLMKATGPVYDAMSYHFYGTVSHRCMGNLKLEQALTADWLDRTDTVEGFYAAIRDKYLPGKAMWLNETAEAACGGDQIAGEFVDTFRYLNQLGTLAQEGVQTVMHNTLASSDYGLLNENTYNPRPDYWAALLWNHTMGTVVLDPKTPKDQPVRVYAQCSRDGKGGVTVLALNTDSTLKQSFTLPRAAERYTLIASDLTSDTVLLNGGELKAGSDGSVRPLHGAHANAGILQLEPASVNFFVIPSAHNPCCK
jgi:heparanase 1